MEKTQSKTDSYAQLLRKVLSLFSLEWIVAGFGLYRDLREMLANGQGMYEILEYDSNLKISDATGKTAVLKRHQKVRFLQNHIIAFQDHIWGDGNIMERYRVSPGIEADRYREGNHWNVLISLRETKSKGDIEDFHIERTVKNGFTKKEEWWQVGVWCKTHKLKLTTLFPRDRHCQRAILQTRSDNKTVVLGPEHFQILPNGRQMLRWETTNPPLSEVYTIRWTW